MSTPIIHKFIKDLCAYDAVDQTFQVAEKQQRKKKDGLPFFIMELRDKTGRIPAIIWNGTPEISAIQQHDFISVKGKIDIYKGDLQVIISSLAPASGKEVNPEYFVAHTTKDIEQMFAQLQEILSKVKEPALANLIREFLDDAGFVEQFKKSPAAVEKHHPYIGGLMEHALNMANLALGVGSQYPTLNTDFLLTGIFLHDIGKIREYETKITPQITDEGRLVGHTVFGILMFNEKISRIKDFPTEYKILLEHLIASHHGQLEYGAPIVPMTQEAIVLHYLDNLDARLGEYQLLLQNAPKNSNWTEWSKGLERKFYTNRNLPKM